MTQASESNDRIDRLEALMAQAIAAIAENSQENRRINQELTEEIREVSVQIKAQATFHDRFEQELAETRKLIQLNAKAIQANGDRFLDRAKYELALIIMAIFLIFVCATGIIVFILPYLLISANPFSQPSGKWQVGTTELIWDKPDLSGIIAKVWYPTDAKNNTSAPYIDNIDLTFSALTAGMNPLFKLIFNKRYFDRIRTPATIDAIPANSPDGFPVLKQLVFQSADHLNFFDLPLIIRPAFGKAIGFIGDRDGRKLLTETAAIAIEFFDREA
jgi:hypothetical protein